MHSGKTALYENLRTDQYFWGRAFRGLGEGAGMPRAHPVRLGNSSLTEGSQTRTTIGKLMMSTINRQVHQQKMKHQTTKDEDRRCRSTGFPQTRNDDATGALINDQLDDFKLYDLTSLRHFHLAASFVPSSSSPPRCEHRRRLDNRRRQRVRRDDLVHPPLGRRLHRRGDGRPAPRRRPPPPRD